MPDPQVPTPGAPDATETVSVVLPVHHGADPGHLGEAVASLLAQTRPADELVVVEDGPLDAAHLAVLADLERRHPRVVRVPLPTNRGAGAANQAGLLAATGTWIAKADADDVNLPGRLQRQLAAVRELGVDLCGSAMLEFEHAVDEAGVLRSMPLTDAAIRRRMATNNPVNHPTAFYRRSAALAVGGYPDHRFMQDYVLFARMAGAGSRMANLPDPLVRFRGGEELHRRRGDRRYTRLELDLRRELLRCGLTTPARSWAVLLARLAYRRLPLPVMRAAHRRLLSGAPGASAESAASALPRVTGDVVRNQAVLAWRSLRVLARRPSLGRELPRLLRTRGRGTMALRLPWLPFRLIDELEDVVGPSARVFEYGGGGSTLWFLDRGAEVVTVEHHAGWADALEEQVPPERWTLLRRSDADAYADYVAAVSAYPDESFDVVLVDGRERVRCAVAAAPKVRPGGLLVLDDSDRDRYAPAGEAITWPREQVVGFAPAKPTLAYTTVFRRPA